MSLVLRCFLWLMLGIFLTLLFLWGYGARAQGAVSDCQRLGMSLYDTPSPRRSELYRECSLREERLRALQNKPPVIMPGVETTEKGNSQ